MKKCSRRIILGSGSPRRRELLAGLGVEFTVDTGNTFQESVPADATPQEVPLLMAQGKSHGFHRP
ncbi:MAG: Maf family protein, partial [Bacteroidales bacterium]|nr:Maf family protein [Bacteroidales bacterium]